MKKSLSLSTFLLLLMIFPLKNLYAEGNAEADGSAAPHIKDFAGTLELTGTPGTLLRFEIPPQIYRGLERPDRGDIRVFDAEGNTVPFMVRPLPETTLRPEPEELPFFIWKRENENRLPGSTDIEINTAGTVMKLKNQEGFDGAENRIYLLDISGLQDLPSSLTVEMDNQGMAFNTAVTIHWGKDLSRWHQFEKKQILAWFGSAGIDRNTLELSEENTPSNFSGSAGSSIGGSAKYLLLDFGPDAPSPLKISAHFKNRIVPGKVDDLLVKGVLSKDLLDVTYDTGGFFPLTSLDFILDEPDIIQVNLKSRLSALDEWITQKSFNLFYLNTGTASGPAGVEKSPPVTVSSSAPFWELTASGEHRFSHAPDLLIQWKTRELVFLSRGNGPWTLAWGNRNCGPVTAGLEPEKIPGSISSAIAGAVTYKERAPIRPTGDHSPWLLWSILGFSVLALSALAFYIVWSMRAS